MRKDAYISHAIRGLLEADQLLCRHYRHGGGYFRSDVRCSSGLPVDHAAVYMVISAQQFPSVDTVSPQDRRSGGALGVSQR